MVRTKDGDGIKSNSIVLEVQKRPCLYDTNHPSYGDRAEKARCWEEVCGNVVPGWCTLALMDKFAAGKEVQKRWRSIRDSYTKAYRQGKCAATEAGSTLAGSGGVGTGTGRRSQYHRQMAFLLRALQNKKPRYSQDKYDSFSEISNSPQHQPPDDIFPKIKNEVTEKPLEKPLPLDKPLDLKTKSDIPEKTEKFDKANQADIFIENDTKTVEHKNPSLEIKIDNPILPDDDLDDDKLFMNSLLPLFKKMDDDTRLLCRIEVLKIIRYALQGHKCFEAIRLAEDSFFKARISGILAKEEMMDSSKPNDSTLSMTTRSADGSRPIRKRKVRTPSPLPAPPKRRGPGRPRKIRPPPSDSDDEQVYRRRSPKLKVLPAEVPPQVSELDETLSKATSVTQLSTPLFMKMYNLERSKHIPTPQVPQPSMMISVKSEPVDCSDPC